MASEVHQRMKAQSASPLGPLGIEAAMEAKANPSIEIRPKIFDEFALTDRVALVSGGNRGLGLEMAIAMCEAGARAVYCFDLHAEPSEEFIASREYVGKLGNDSRLEYFTADVRDQHLLHSKAEEIGDREQRMDICIAAAGIVKGEPDYLECSAEQFREVLDVNTCGVFFTAQAAGRQMARFGRGGSIILIASILGSVASKDPAVISYNTSKSAVLQMARSMACELGVKKIRVNTISPGYIYTKMTAAFLDKELLNLISSMNPLGRMGRSDELRGIATWLASDASSFCTGSDIEVSGGHLSW